jgi:AcrR family transcriptional regulator
MWSDTPEGQELIQEVSKRIVAEVDPEELVLFDELMESYFANPHPSSPEKDDPLGFGLGEFVSLVTLAAGAAVSAVLTYILNEVIETIQEEGARAITERIRDWLNSESAAKALTAEQLKRIQEITIQQAELFDMDTTKARLMASALVGSLALPI